MTELWIDNDRVVLPKNLSFTLNEENPEITGNGEYSWDISASLLNSTNAKIFKHIYRVNVTDYPTSYDAKLVIDNHVRNGKIIILSNTDEEVKFQFIAGNSDMNYQLKNDTRKIWELNWETESAIDYARALESIQNPGYYYHEEWGRPPIITKRYFVCAPIQLNDQLINDYTISDKNVVTSTESQINGISGKIIMQPYILYYINHLPGLLGYSLKYNVLSNDERAKIMYFINHVDSLKYSDALPDWTISEFITEIELLFNVEFRLDSSDKSISIHSSESSMAQKKIISVEKVMDSWDRSITDDSKPLRYSFTKISYDLPSDNNYFRWQKLADNIYEQCEKLDFEDFAALEAYIRSHTGVPDKLRIYRDMELENDYIYVSNDYISGSPDIKFYTYPFTLDGDFDYLKVITNINKFSSVGNSSEKEIVLKIIPSEVYRRSKLLTVITGSGTGSQMLYYQLPYKNTSYFIEKTAGLKASVESTVPKLSRSDKIEVALFTGRIETYHVNELGYIAHCYLLFPFSHIDILPEFCGSFSGYYLRKLNDWINTVFKISATKSLKLKGSGGILSDYRQDIIIDTTKEYNHTIFDTPGVSVNDILVIQNKEYMPISLEHEVTIDGFGKKVTGKFYALK